MSVPAILASMPGDPSPQVPQTPLQRQAPLAPSQELAYRQKCIALKRRLTEIENNNDDLRRRLEREKRFQDKMRLNRAVLLNHLKDMMDIPNKKLTKKELDIFSSSMRGGANLAEHMGYDLSETAALQGDARSGYMLDDSSVGSEDDDVPEPQERPLRSKRPHNSAANPRDSVVTNVSNADPSPMNTTHTYHHSSLPNLAPATTYPPTIAHQESTTFAPLAPVAPPLPRPSFYGQQNPQRPHQQPQHFSPPLAPSFATPTPAYSNTNMVQTASEPGVPATTSSYAAPYPPHEGPPPRPRPPFEQFTEHMIPQLQADNYPPEDMDKRIKHEWTQMSAHDRHLWDQRYQEQMVEYEQGMDEWKKEQRRKQEIRNASAGSNGTVVGSSGTGFAAVNR